MSPKMIDKAQRKTEIALIALDLFAEKGYNATSISSVAKAAGIAKGTIYEYFASKDELIISAFMVWIESMGQGMEEVFAVENAEERLRRYAQRMMEAFVRDERTVRLMVSIFQMILQDHTQAFQQSGFQEIFRGVRQSFLAILLDGVSQGIFRPEIEAEAEKIAANLFAYLNGIALHYFLNTEDIALMQYVNFYLERLICYLKEEPYA